MRGRLAWAGAALVLAAALAVPLADTLLYRGSIHPGVTVWGVDVGGLTREQALAALDARVTGTLDRTMELLHDQGGFAFVPRDSGVLIDVAGAVDQALQLSGETLDPVDMIDRLRLWVSPRDVEPAVKVDGDAQAAWQALLDEAALAVERLPKDARLMLTDEGPKAVAAEDGSRMERSSLAGSILAAVSTGSPTVDIPVSAVVPAVTTDDARRALDGARVAFSAPVTLGYQGVIIELGPEELLTMAEVNPGGVASGLPLTFDTPRAEELLGPRLAKVAVPPVDAEITPDPSGRGFTVVPSRDGTLVEWEPLTGALARAALSVDRRYVPIPTKPARPNLSTEDAEELGIRRAIASFTTYFSPANQARVNNIKQVAGRLDGILVKPGATFSFNATVGPRTRAAGYDEAPVIRDGVLTPGVGGGICQVSTTLFNAVFFAGLPVIERRPHSFYIDHYPVGRDATVSYGAVDLKFRNDSDELILISVTAGDDSVTVSLAAPEWDRTVEYDTSGFRDLESPVSSAAKPRRLRDPALPAGQVSALEEGVEGRTVEVTRRVLRADGSLVFTDEFVSTYAPKDFIVRVGG